MLQYGAWREGLMMCVIRMVIRGEHGRYASRSDRTPPGEYGTVLGTRVRLYRSEMIISFVRFMMHAVCRL
jgi:hypothetical protein